MARIGTAFKVALLLAGLIPAQLPACFGQSTNPRARNKVFITGAVSSPGVYQIEDAPSLQKLLALAGGLAANHGSRAFVLRRVKEETADNFPAYAIHPVSIDEALSGDSDKDETLEPGDIVSIPPADVFFISGDSIRSGSYPFKEGMTLLQALATANVLTHGSSGKKR